MIWYAYVTSLVRLHVWCFLPGGQISGTSTFSLLVDFMFMRMAFGRHLGMQKSSLVISFNGKHHTLTQSHLLNIPLHCPDVIYESLTKPANPPKSKIRRRKVCHNNMKKRINIRSCSAILRCQSSTKSHPDSGRPRVIQLMFCQVAAKHRIQWSSPNMFASPITPAPSCTLNFWLKLASKNCFRTTQELTTC